jgi:branched-subunit amino acid ABC-type transport system permease component
MAVLGMLIARYLVLPLRTAPALNTLLITLMLGTVLREAVRLFYPQGANPKPFPALLPRASVDIGTFNLRLDNVLMLAAGVAVIVGTVLFTAAGGAVAGELRRRSGSVLASVGMHWATNALGVLFGLLAWQLA